MRSGDLAHRQPAGNLRLGRPHRLRPAACPAWRSLGPGRLRLRPAGDGGGRARGAGAARDAAVADPPQRLTWAASLTDSAQWTWWSRGQSGVSSAAMKNALPLL